MKTRTRREVALAIEDGGSTGSYRTVPARIALIRVLPWHRTRPLGGAVYAVCRENGKKKEERRLRIQRKESSIHVNEIDYCLDGCLRALAVTHPRLENLYSKRSVALKSHRLEQ